MTACPCGLRPACPHGQQPGTVLDCPVWLAHVRPRWYERALGALVALVTGRW
jgi:hypothetical protein